MKVFIKQVKMKTWRDYKTLLPCWTYLGRDESQLKVIKNMKIAELHKNKIYF